MKPVTRRARAVVFAGTAALALACGADAVAQTVSRRPTQPAFGLVGIARGQSARLNVFIGNPDFNTGGLPPDPCRVTLAFANEAGQPVRDRLGDVVMADGSVRPGESISLLLPAVQLPAVQRGRRGLVRPVVQAGSPADSAFPPDPCRGLVATLEVFDGPSGRTSVLYAATFGFNAPPDPDTPSTSHPPEPDKPAAFAPVALVRGDSAELHVAIGNPDFIGGPGATVNADLAPSSLPPDPCHVTLGFVDDAGAPFVDRKGRAVSADGSVRPGQSLSLELTSSEVFRPRDGRRQNVRAIFTTDPPDPELPVDPCRNLAPTLELLDGATGRTSILYAPGLANPPDPDRPAGQ
jgi:hypothetical protein